MRTVLTIDPTGDIDPETQSQGMMLKVERHHEIVPGMNKSKPLKVSVAQPADWSAADAVAARGLALRDALRKHVGVAGVLDSLERAPQGTVRPLYVKLSEGDAELINWEALCDTKNAFMALDRRWPIGRITDPATSPRNRPLFRLPLRLVVVISALGIANQEAEWAQIRQAVLDARGNIGGKPLDVTVHAVVGEQALYDVIRKDIANGLLWASVAGVATASELMATIGRANPNILHFFCHGRAGGSEGEQELQLATASDHSDKKLKLGSVKVTPAQLMNLASDLDNPLLITLNCCASAQAATATSSLAYRVVASGFPAAVAMVEPVDASDAYAFTGALYGALFRELKKVARDLAAGGPGELEWASALSDARVAISAIHGSPGSRREWALPALYVRGVDTMQFVAPPAGESEMESSQHRIRAGLVAEWLTNAGHALPRHQREAVMQDVLAAVPKIYWPNADGAFDG